LIPVDVALGKGEFYDVVSLYSDERSSAEMYYRLLNCGFRLAATGGTDNFPDVWRDPPPGTDRTYARVTGLLSVQSWLAAIKAGRTFGTTGPLVFLTVDGREPGSEITPEKPIVTVTAVAQSISPVEKLEILVNGKVAATATPGPTDPTSIRFEGPVPVPDGGWVAARVVGPPSKYVADSYGFAQTTPVYVLRNGAQWVSKEDAKFLADVVDAIWARAGRSEWRSEQERGKFHAEIEAAKAVYLKLAGGG
jgi:hypothetical protein